MSQTEQLLLEIQKVFERRCGRWVPDPKWIEATLCSLQENACVMEQLLPGKLEKAKAEGAEEERERLKGTVQVVTLQPGQHKVYFNGMEISETSLYENAEFKLIQLHKALGE